MEKSGPWNFDNNLLLLCRWKKGLTSKNISFSSSPFWVQIWGLPFENMTEAIGKEIGGKIGRVLEVDKRAMQAELAKYLRVRVEVPIDKSLRRGCFVKSEEGERVWVDFRYERLPSFCYICGFLGHDEKHCQVNPAEQRSGRQYGEWLKAGGALKNGGEGVRMKMQSEARKGGMYSRVMEGENSAESEAERRNSPAAMEAETFAEKKGQAEMKEAGPMALVEEVVLSHHRDMRGQSIGDGSVQHASGEGLVKASREEEWLHRAGSVGLELNENQKISKVRIKSNGPACGVDEDISPFGPKGKEKLNEAKVIGLSMEGAKDLNEVNGLVITDELKKRPDKQPLKQGQLNRRVIREKMKNMARGKVKNQNKEEYVKAREVSRKRKIYDDNLIACDNRILKRFCEEKGGDGEFSVSFSETAVTAEQHRLDQ